MVFCTDMFLVLHGHVFYHYCLGSYYPHHASRATPLAPPSLSYPLLERSKETQVTASLNQIKSNSHLSPVNEKLVTLSRRNDMNDSRTMLHIRPLCPRSCCSTPPATPHPRPWSGSGSRPSFRPRFFYASQAKADQALVSGVYPSRTFLYIFTLCCTC